MALVYKFGLLAPVDGAGLVDTTMRRAFEYRNRLVEVEVARRNELRELERSQGAIAAYEARTEDAQKIVDDLVERLKALRAAAWRERHRDSATAKPRRTRATAKDAAPTEDIRQVRATLKEARARLKEAKKALVEERRRVRALNAAPPTELAVRAAKKALDAASPGSPARKAARAKLHEALAKLRADPTGGTFGIEARAQLARRVAQQQSGLYWGTYELVNAADETMRKMPLYNGAQPLDPRKVHPAQSSTRIGLRWSGGLPISEAFAGRDAKLRLVAQELPIAGSRHLGRSFGLRRDDARARPVDSKRALRTMLRDLVILVEEGKYARFPLATHRPIPHGALLKSVAVTKDVCGPMTQWSVEFTLETNAPARQCGQGGIALDVGWRVMGNEIRVARWVAENGESGELRLPALLIDALGKASSIRSIRRTAFDRMLAVLSKWLKAHNVPEWLAEQRETLPLWKSQGRLAVLVRQWSLNRFAGDEQIFGTAEERRRVPNDEPETPRKRKRRYLWRVVREGSGLAGWASRDFHLWVYETNLRRKALRRRNDLYRVAAATLARRFETCIFEDFDLRRIARKRPVDATGHDNDTARSNRQLVAVSLLRNIIINAFVNRGGHHAEVPGIDSTRTCHVCGARANWDAAALVTGACPNGHVWDQDDNAGHVLLARWVQAGRPIEEQAPREKKWDKIRRLAKAKREAPETQAVE